MFSKFDYVSNSTTKQYADYNYGPALGFVFADPFDILLRHLDANYLKNAWNNLQEVFSEYKIAPNDLSWGCLSPGHSGYWGNLEDAPSDLTGWTSRELYISEQNQDKRNEEIDKRLKAASPPLRVALSYRSVKWKVSSQDFEEAMRLLTWLCSDDAVDWRPANILEQDRNRSGLWGDIARAIAWQEQAELDELMARAKREYTSAGYEIVVRGFTNYVANGENVDGIHIKINR